MVEGGGFEPPKVEPSDLQSDPFGRSGTPPLKLLDNYKVYLTKNQAFSCLIWGVFLKETFSTKN